MNGERNSLRDILVVVGALVLMGALFLLAQYSKSVSLNRSATGFDGLPLWLESNDVGARTFYGRAVLDPEDNISLRVLPLYDVDLKRDADVTNDPEAAMVETDRDITPYVIERKIETISTLIILPKWRSGVRQAGALHPELLISDASAKRIASQIEGDIGTLVREKDISEVTGETPSGSGYKLHYRQTLGGTSCKPIIGTKDAMLLGRCSMDHEWNVFWVLADPDLLNNHGLSQGGNAEAALNLLPDLTGRSGEIVLDLTTSNWVRRFGSADAGQRNWSDLARFFDYPFSVIWWSLGILGALTFWRAWRRYGAADARSEEEKGPQASRLVSIDTKARLLRLTGRDDALVRTHIDGRLEVLADELLGPQRSRGEAGVDLLISAIARRSPDLAAEYAPFREGGMNAGNSPDMLMRVVAQFDDLIERTLDEFGRTGRAR